MTRPRYQEIPSGSIPEVGRAGGMRIRVVAGDVNGVRGPVTEIAADPTYLDVTVPGGMEFQQEVPRGHALFTYVFEWVAVFDEERL